MAGWLFSIVGVVIIGVLTELVSGETKMGKFVRAIYSFVILFIIVQPIPKLLNEKISFFEDGAAVSTELLEQIEQGTDGAKAVRVGNLLTQMGYGDCLVTVDGDTVYITVQGFVSPITARKIKRNVARELSTDETNIFLM
jgi:hypothetical protein